jgi:hypothetical protein
VVDVGDGVGVGVSVAVGVGADQGVADGDREMGVGQEVFFQASGWGLYPPIVYAKTRRYPVIKMDVIL